MRKLLLLMVVLAMTLSLTGCGDENLFESMADDSSTEAKVDAGIEALNDGDYAEAIKILKDVYQDNPTDPEVQKYYASALAGDAGIDTLDLMADIGDAQETGANDSVVYDSTLSTILGVDTTDPTWALDANQLADLSNKVDQIEEAVSVLAPGGVVTEETEFQAGFYSAIKVALEIEEMLGGQNPENMTSIEIDAALADDDFGGLYNSLGIVAQTQESLVENLATGENSEIGSDFETYLVEIGYYVGDPTTGIPSTDPPTVAPSIDATDVSTFLNL